MKFSTGLTLVTLLSGSLLGQEATPTPYSSGSSSSGDQMAAPSPTPTPTTVENLIRLWKANLSEDFLRKYIDSADVRRDLSADDIVKLRNAGLPESLITAVTDRKAGVAASGSGAPGMSGSMTASGAPMSAAPTPTPSLTGSARWEGLAKRNGGIIIFKSRWDPGVLEFKEDTLRWTDGRDASKNVLLTAKQITEQQLTCLKKPGGNECFEWVVKSKGDEYRFRDISWEQGENGKPQEVFRFMKTALPNLVSSQVPVDSK